MGRVLVVGSINIDLVATVPRLPQPGETVLATTFARHDGGKGANAAVAAARAGARVAIIGAVGTDADGESQLRSLAAEGVSVDAVLQTEAPTGSHSLPSMRRARTRSWSPPARTPRSPPAR